MSNFHGMDPDHIEGLGRRINNEASSLNSIIHKLDGLVASMQSNWKGADSNRFNDTYQHQYRTQMSQAVQHLEALSQSALRNASEQRRVSS